MKVIVVFPGVSGSAKQVFSKGKRTLRKVGRLLQSWNSRKLRLLSQNGHSETFEHKCTPSSTGRAHSSLIMFIMTLTIMMLGKA